MVWCSVSKYAHRGLMLFVAGESNSCALSVSAAVSKYAYLQRWRHLWATTLIFVFTVHKFSQTSSMYRHNRLLFHQPNLLHTKQDFYDYMMLGEQVLSSRLDALCGWWKHFMRCLKEGETERRKVVHVHSGSTILYSRSCESHGLGQPIVVARLVIAYTAQPLNRSWHSPSSLVRQLLGIPLSFGWSVPALVLAFVQNLVCFDIVINWHHRWLQHLCAVAITSSQP